MMFHVEHAPVEEVPPVARAFLQQTMQIRIYQLQGQRGSQIKACGSVPVIQFVAQRIVVAGNADAMRQLATTLQAPVQSEVLRTLFDQLARFAIAEGAATSQQIQRFQNTCLARCVVATDDIHASRRLKFNGFETTKVPALEARYAHGRARVDHADRGVAGSTIRQRTEGWFRAAPVATCLPADELVML